MKHTVNVSWLKDMAFEADVEGHKIYVDAKPESGGNNTGPTPKPLMLVALAGCTGMDVVSILKKMRVEYESFDIEVQGETIDDFPKNYKEMKLIYKFKGKDLPKDKIEKAVNLSQDKYCGVSASYKKALELNYEIVIE